MQIKKKLMFTSVLETIYGLGVSGWAGCLLSKIASYGIQRFIHESLASGGA